MLGTIDRDVVYRLLDALSQGDAALLLEEVDKADAFAPDYGALLGDVVSVLQRIAIAQALPDAIDDSFGDRDAVIALADKLSAEDVQLYYQIGLIGRRDLPLSPEPRGGFEMVMLRMLAFRPAAFTQEGASASAPSKAPQQSRAPRAEKPSAQPASSPAADNDKPGSASTSEWAGIIESLSLKGMTREMSLNCEFHGMQDDIIKLSLDPAHIHLLGKARVEQLEAALCEHYQRPVTIKIAREGKLENETPAGQRTREQNERQQQAEQSILMDENVKAMQDAFGGSVDQGSIRPRD
jgi:DNA polymerase-3 subunit gamma/tau